MSGRLSGDEFEARVAEAWSRALLRGPVAESLRWLPVERPPAPARRPGSGTAVASLVLGPLDLCVLTLTLGLFFIIALPLSVSACGLGRDARRSDTTPGAWPSPAQVLGIVGRCWRSERRPAAPRFGASG